jgi:DNA-binding transcriptional MerR regulator
VNQTLRFFSPQETARRLGVSVKALRVYEAEGLVTPARTGAGWRVYGPDQMARLHQVLALKRLGLPLKRISELLAGELEGLDSVLAVQEQALARQKQETEQGLRLLAHVRRRLKAGETLSMDDLNQLTRETTMDSNRLDPAEWNRVFGPLTRKHFTPAEQAVMAERQRRSGEAGQNAWSDLFTEAKAAFAEGADPASPELMDLACRWMALAKAVNGEDPVVIMKVGIMWDEAFQDADFRERSPVSPELMAYVKRAIIAAYAAGVMSPP